MIEVVFALLMFLNGNLENYSPKNNLADCLEQKRKVERDGSTSSVRMECKEVEAVVETDKHGVKRIKEIKGIK
jgi:hypothetical protein